MAIEQANRNQATVISKYVTLPATSGTTVGVAVPAGSYVIAAGFQALQTVPSVTTYTMNLTDGTTTFGSALNFNNVAKNTIKVGATAGLIAAADTVDVVTTISGSPGTIYGRVFIIVANVDEGTLAAATVDRDVIG